MASITINLVDVVKNLSRQECQETIRLCATRLHMLQNMSLTHEEKMCVEDNRKIDAIRSFRNRTGVRLKDAKDVVEAYAATLQVLPTPEEMYWGSVADERRRQEAERKMEMNGKAGKVCTSCQSLCLTDTPHQDECFVEPERED